MDEKCKFHPIKPSPRCRICKSDTRDDEKTADDVHLKKPQSRHGLMPVWGDKNTWNISSLMRKNVFASAYFNKELFNLRDLSAVLDEIKKHVQSIEPWIKGSCNIPSTFFCVLIKLFILKLTEGQLRFMLDSPNPYIKSAGILYIRFLSDPAELWDRLKDLTLCSDIIPENNITISDLISQVLSSQDFYSLQLPRIPAKIQLLINKKISEIPQRNARFAQNLHKSFEKDSTVFLYLDDPVPVTFKARDGQKVHVQHNGKDLHVHISEVDDIYISPQTLQLPSTKILADTKSEYTKKSSSYGDSLIFKIPEKRQRSPSPPPQAHLPLHPKPELLKVSIISKHNSTLDDQSEYIKLG